MICSALLKLERFRCPCGPDAACNCPPLEVEAHVVGVVDGSSSEFAVDITGAAEVESGLVVTLTPREEMWATMALCSEYERRERLELEARGLRLLPYILPEVVEC